ncbi:MAG: transporter, family, multidrug resistance protein [Candidatus Eremiobacteraeota bacterium]|nr:transporter, family, multidrug resistance protein [Candidatus Eremiobacteraeota bacterium]MEA2720589.1 transporter, family, multidrug resistance protein [Candidatus Eremiobacteraeota bacterium]
MALIDGTVVNVGLDTMAGNLGASIDEASWISSIYVLAGIFVMPLTGWVATNLGRKRAFQYAVVCFTAGSLLCAMAGSLEQLVAMRFVQGIGGGLLMPLAMAALVDAYPAEELSSAFKVYGVSVMAGPALGPALGGWILSNATWPWIFLINVPLGIVSLFLIGAVVRDQSERGERSAFDWGALTIMVVGFAALQYVVQEGPRHQWFASFDVTLAAAVACTALFIFVRMQLRAAVPLVDFRPVAIPSYAVAMVLALITGVGFTGTALIAPLYMQDVLRYGPDMAGFVMVPNAVGVIIGTEISGRLSKWVPAGWLSAVSLALCAGGTFWFAFLGDRPGFDHALMPRFIQGFGVGLLYVPLNVLMMSQVPKRLVDAASGLGALTRQVSAGLGFAILGTLIVQNRIAATSLTASRVRHATLFSDPGLVAIQRWFAAHGYSNGDASALSMPVLGELVARAATSAAYSETFFIVAILFVVSIPFLLLFNLVPRKAADPV